MMLMITVSITVMGVQRPKLLVSQPSPDGILPVWHSNLRCLMDVVKKGNKFINP